MYNDNGTSVVFDAEKLKSSLRDQDKFVKLQNEALAIREGDAMSPIVKSNGGTLMQDASISKVKNVDIRYDRGIDFNTPVVSKKEEISGLLDEVFDSQGVKQRELPDWEGFSKKIHAGENNVEFNSSYINGEYKGRVNLVDANSVPNSTFDAIEERIGEINTYTNANSRSFEIVLPKEAEGTELGNWYEDALDKMKNGDGRPKSKGLSTKNTSYYTSKITELTSDLSEGKITKEIYEEQVKYFTNMTNSQKDFYNNIKIIYE